MPTNLEHRYSSERVLVTAGGSLDVVPDDPRGVTPYLSGRPTEGGFTFDAVLVASVDSLAPVLMNGVEEPGWKHVVMQWQVTSKADAEAIAAAVLAPFQTGEEARS